MIYTKPYYFYEALAPEKYVMEYRWRERKTDSLVFRKGHKLPFDSGNPHLSYTLQDPQEYDLIFHSESEPERFTALYDVLPNNCPAPLVNEKVKNILESLCPDDVQFFPTTIVPAKEKMEPFENHDYFLLNICSIYDDVDFEKSEVDLKMYAKDGPPIKSGYKKLFFRELQGQKIPYIGRLIYSMGCIIVHPDVVKIFKKEKVKGARFIKNSDGGDKL